MASEVYVLACDLGTTGNKATLYSSSGVVKAATFAGYDVHYPRRGWSEQDPEAWWQSVCQATRELIAKGGVSPSDIACIVFSGQMMGCVAVDRDARALRPAIIWSDVRAERQAARLADAVGAAKVYQVTGHRCSASYSGAKMMWVMDNEPEVYKKTYKFLQAKDYIVARLTGEFVTDHSDASGTNLFDLKALNWSEELVAGAGLDPDRLPRSVPSTTVVGKVLPDAARETGLAAGTPVVIGGGDGSCAAAGSGTIRPGIAYNYVGSSSWIGLATTEPIYDPKMRTFNWAHVVPGLYSPTGTMQAAGASYQWLRDVICEYEKELAQRQGVSAYKLMDEEAASVPAGSEGLIYLPYLLGERSPRWNPSARGCFCGLTIRHTRAHIVRSVLEGVIMNLAIILDAMREQGVEVSEMRVIGGGAKGAVWRQMMADIYGCEILKPTLVDEATSLGAAVTGGVGVGLFPDFSVTERLVEIEDRCWPNEANRATYARLRDVFEKYYQALEPVFNTLD